MLRSTTLSVWLLLGAMLLALAPASAQTIVESRVAASTDDAEEAESGSVSVVGSDLELGWDGAPQVLGLRFPGLAVPPNANVTAAWVQFEADEDGAADLTLAFTVEASDDAAPFTTADGDLTDRTREAASVPWTPAPWSAGDEGADQRTPDLSSLVQAVVGRPGWTEGNALVLLVEGPDSGNARRTATAWNADPAHAPLLHVEFDLIEVNDPPTLSITSPIDMSQFTDDTDVALSATANDPEQGDLSAAILWTSSLDGIVGIGGNVSAPLSVGIHTLTADVVDDEGLAASASVDVRVTAEGHLVLAAGDIATCNTFFGDEATAELLDERFGEILALGDIAYPDGTTEDFASCYAPTWGRHQARTWPAPGNHEYHVEGAADYLAWFGPRAGSPGRLYYSFDIGSWHIVMLDTNCSDNTAGCGADDPQGLWLEADLAANPSECSLMVTHQARYASGELHGSDDRLADLFDIFHAHGGDIVLSGHDHHYERFAPQDAFGNFDSTGPTQFVVGTGGVNLRDVGPIEPNSITSAGNLFGILGLTLYETSYDWEFLPAAGYSYADSGSASCVGLTEPPPNVAPQVLISEPVLGGTVVVNTAVTFSGSAHDAEDGPLDAGLTWTSDLDGVIGTGPSFVLSSLSEGFHRIEATATDSEGATGSAVTTIRVSQPATLEIEAQISDGDDDAEEELKGPHNVSVSSTDLELGEDQDVQLVGLRFPELEIPQGIEILEAWIQFEAAGSSSASTDLEIGVQASDDAPPFAADRHDLSDRPLGGASVVWSPPGWSDGQDGTDQRTPDLTELVQETVDRAGWVPGNAMAFLIEGNGVRRAESRNGSAAGAPTLHVRYRNPNYVPPKPGGAGCGVGPELALVVPLLAALRRRRARG